MSKEGEFDQAEATEADTNKALYAAAKILGMALWRLRTELTALNPDIPFERCEHFGNALKIADDANKQWLAVQSDPRVRAIAAEFR